MLKISKTRRRAMALAVWAVAGGSAQAQDFPSKPITIVVPFAAGGATDITARRLGESLARVLSSTVVIENRPGAATTLGAGYVARAPKDGYTLLMAPGSTTSVNPWVFKTLPYKLDDFAPVSLVSKLPFVLAATPGLPPRTVPELIAYAKKKGDGMTYGTTGTGGMSNIIGEWIGRTLSMKVIEVPYKGTAPANVDLIGGRLELNVDALSTSVPMHMAGQIRILAVMADTRSPLLPEVPTFKESGYPDLQAYTTFGLLAPAGTPEGTVRALHKAVAAAVAAPEFSAKLAAGGETAVASDSPKQYQTLLHDEYERWGRIIKPLNLKPE